MIVGVDEVGRGCLFGPVFAAAVSLTESAAAELTALGLTDSKALSARRRLDLVPHIQAKASAWALGQGSAREIDAHGIRVATELAMLRALQKLPKHPELVLVDGVLPLRLWPGAQRSIVRGDSKEASIAAASVLAKVTRDGLMQRLAERFPGYGLERHAGYGTVLHRQSLIAAGPTSMHRHSFLTRLFPSDGAQS